MTAVMTDNGMMEISNDHLQPPQECFFCHDTNLVHEFNGGHMSDQYSGSTCPKCGSVQSPCLGMWYYELNNNEYRVYWFYCPSGHPLENSNLVKASKGVQVEKKIIVDKQANGADN